MENKYLRYLGMFIIFTGLIGLLFVTRGNLMGYAVFDGQGDSITGMAVLGDTKNNVLGYFIFAVIITLGLFVAFKGRASEDSEKVSKKEKSDEDDYGLLDRRE